MRYRYQRTRKFLQSVVKSLFGNVVKVVGRLVENQHIGALKHYNAKCNLGTVCSRQIAYPFKYSLILNQQPAERTSYFKFSLCRISSVHSLYYGVVKVEVAELLVKISDLYVSSEFDLPRIWYFLRTAFKKMICRRRFCL